MKIKKSSNNLSGNSSSCKKKIFQERLSLSNNRKTKIRAINKGYKKNIPAEEKEKENENNIKVAVQLKELCQLFPYLPTLLAGSLRHLKVEPHYREPTSRLWLSPQTYRKTSKIRLTGNWIEKAGFICHERIRVIPMHRMLIIVPETGCTNEHESETNEHE